MKFHYSDLYYTVIENRDDEKIVIDNCEKNYLNYDDFRTPNHYNGRKKNNIILR